MFFRSWGGDDNLVTDSRSVFWLMTLTQRKWVGPLISGTWSKAKCWPRLAWQESIQDHWGQCKNVLEKTAFFLVLLQKHPTLTMLKWTRPKDETKKQGWKTNLWRIWSLPLKYNHETLQINLIYQAYYNYQCYISIKGKKMKNNIHSQTSFSELWVQSSKEQTPCTHRIYNKITSSITGPTLIQHSTC